MFKWEDVSEIWDNPMFVLLLAKWKFRRMMFNVVLGQS